MYDTMLMQAARRFDRNLSSRVHHRMGTPQLPEEGAAGPAFAHLYIVDPNAANNMRLNFSRLKCMKFATSSTKRSESTIKSRRFSNAQCKIQAKRTNQVLIVINTGMNDIADRKRCNSSVLNKRMCSF